MTTKIKWEKYDFGSSKHLFNDDLIVTTQNENYKFQGEILKKELTFGEKLFGDYDIKMTVFNHNSEQIDYFQFKGMNGNFDGAKSLLEILKEKALSKYGN